MPDMMGHWFAEIGTFRNFICEVQCVRSKSLCVVCLFLVYEISCNTLYINFIFSFCSDSSRSLFILVGLMLINILD